MRQIYQDFCTIVTINLSVVLYAKHQLDFQIFLVLFQSPIWQSVKFSVRLLTFGAVFLLCRMRMLTLMNLTPMILMMRHKILEMMLKKMMMEGMEGCCKKLLEYPVMLLEVNLSLNYLLKKI